MAQEETRRIDSIICRVAEVETGREVKTARKTRRKPTLPESAARAVLAHILHDYYNATYGEIAAYTNITLGAAMKCAAKARELIFTDRLHKIIFNRAMNILTIK